MQSTILDYANIEARSYVDGPGARTVIFFQGCNLGCQGCQSPHLWDPNRGRHFPVSEVAETLSLLAINGQITISGGEPFQQPTALAELVYRLRLLGISHIIVYTGYTWEELLDSCHPAFPYAKAILEKVDILVDGRFVRQLDDPFISYRGSRNQRPIDVIQSLASGQVVMLDWDNELTITTQGEIVLPSGFARNFDQIGVTTSSRRCGQVLP